MARTHSTSKTLSKGDNHAMLLKDLVRALAREQARKDYEAMQKNETRSHIR